MDNQEIVNDGERYTITIKDFFHEKSYVVYVVHILDQCFNENYFLCFRYKSLKTLHEALSKDEKAKDILPEFPKTKSFLFVNRTNKNSRNIQERARQLEYYLYKLLNIKELTNHFEIKGLLSKAKKSNTYKKRSKSETRKLENEFRRNSSSDKMTTKSSYQNSLFFQMEYL